MMEEENSSYHSTETGYSQELHEGQIDNDCRNKSYRSVSSFQVLMHLIKASLGIGILYLPKAFSKEGVLFGPVLAIIFMLPVAYCTFIVVKCSREIIKRSGKSTIGYAGTFRYALTPYLGEKSRILAYVTNVLLVASQLGLCCAYLVFAAETLNTFGFFPGDVRLLIAAIGGVVIIPASLLPVDVMSVLSGYANVLLVFSLSATVVYIGFKVKSPFQYPIEGNIKELPKYFSALAFTFEGINSVIPMDNVIKEPTMYYRVLGASMAFTTCCYFIVGYLGFLAFGNAVEDSVTLNLPYSPFTNIVKIVYALCVLLSYFIQFYVAMNSMLPTILKNASGIFSSKCITICSRAFFSLLTIILAVTVPRLGDIISLIGAIACALLGFVFPCIIHIATFWRTPNGERTISWLVIIIDILIIIFGILLWVLGLFTTILNIVHPTHSSKTRHIKYS